MPVTRQRASRSGQATLAVLVRPTVTARATKAGALTAPQEWAPLGKASGHPGGSVLKCQTLVMAVERTRRVEVRPFPSNRRLVTAAMRAGQRKMPMYGLVDVDVTTANRLLASHDPPSSLTAFVVASVARAAAAHPEVHAYRNWRGQLVTHHHVDVGTMVEISTPQGPFAIPHLLRDADIREGARAHRRAAPRQARAIGQQQRQVAGTSRTGRDSDPGVVRPCMP